MEAQVGKKVYCYSQNACTPQDPRICECHSAVRKLTTCCYGKPKLMKAELINRNPFVVCSVITEFHLAVLFLQSTWFYSCSVLCIVFPSATKEQNVMR